MSEEEKYIDLILAEEEKMFHLICPTVSWMKELMAESFSLLLPSQMVTMWNLEQKRLFVNINISNHRELTLQNC